MAKYPTAVFSVPVVLFNRDSNPTAVVESTALFLPASYPMRVVNEFVVPTSPAWTPSKVLLDPVVVLLPALSPTAVFLTPDVK